MGNITIGNVSVKNLSAEEIAKNIMYIPQNPKLFNRSLYDNIVYGLDKPPSKQQILDILNNMDMNIISNDFKDKMDELCGHDGSSLSGGQRQIVWLLRSLYRVKPIIILDEPTSALDPENKKIVMNAIKKVGIGKTIIIISHDEIDGEFKKVHFKNGQIVESNFSMYF
jgi:ABC-type bacteriocin/lantibiotic exporter with double-glycine peptidase domain